MSIPLSKACCAAPVVREEYDPKGEFSTFQGEKACTQQLKVLGGSKLTNEAQLDITGNTSSKRAVLFAYDACGFASQSFQGAVSANILSFNSC